MFRNGLCILKKMDIPGLVNFSSLGVVHKKRFFPLGNSNVDARDRVIIEFIVEVVMDVESGFTAEGAYHGDRWFIPGVSFIG